MNVYFSHVRLANGLPYIGSWLKDLEVQIKMHCHDEHSKYLLLFNISINVIIWGDVARIFEVAWSRASCTEMLTLFSLIWDTLLNVARLLESNVSHACGLIMISRNLIGRCHIWMSDVNDASV
jgi:hypothetical protein